MELSFVVELNPVTKKNSQMPIIIKGKNGSKDRVIILPSKQYSKYEKAAYPFMPSIDPIDKPVNVKCLFYMATRRKCDLTNLLEAIDDVMVKYGVVSDDNFSVIYSHDGSRVLYDKNRPRTEVYITEATDYVDR